MVATSPPDIDFPWATKNIYREVPGVCGLELSFKDTLLPLDCTRSGWKYKKRSSVFTIRDKDLVIRRK